MQTINQEWKLDDSFREVSSAKKKGGSHLFCISSLHGICILVAMEMWLLRDQFICRSGTCRCYWVQLSIAKPWLNDEP